MFTAQNLINGGLTKTNTFINSKPNISSKTGFINRLSTQKKKKTEICMLDWGSKLYEITSNTTYYWLRILLQDMYDCVEQILAGDYKYFYYYYYWLRTFDPRSRNKKFDTLFKSRASWWMGLNYLIYVLFGYLWLISSF